MDFRVSPLALGRTRFWLPKGQRPRRTIVGIAIGGRALQPEEARGLLGVSFCPDWTYVVGTRAPLMVALDDTSSSPGVIKIPCVFPMPLPESQIQKQVLKDWRRVYGPGQGYGDIARCFKSGKKIGWDRVSDLFPSHDLSGYTVPDPVIAMSRMGRGILIASGPERQQNPVSIL